MTMIPPDDNHDDLNAEFEVARGVVAFNALGGLFGDESPRLWAMAQAHGIDLEDFVDDVLALAGRVLRMAASRSSRRSACPVALAALLVGGKAGAIGVLGPLRPPPASAGLPGPPALVDLV